VSGYTPPPGVYFLDTFVLYQGGGNLNPATGSRSSTRVTENFDADIAIVGWFSYALKAGPKRSTSAPGGFMTSMFKTGSAAT
jgi:hypothetical protein